MQLHELKPAAGATKKRKRVGRGPGSGHGKTSCRGHKGQKSRSGSGHRRGFEGGQMPLQRRLPKRGFTNIFRKEYALIKLCHLESFEDGAVVTPEQLLSKGLIKKKGQLFKVLGNGELSKKLTVQAHKFSTSAQDKIKACGGVAELLS